MLYEATVAHCVAHLRFEESVRGATVRLRTIKRRIGVIKEDVALRPVIGAHRNADTGGGEHRRAGALGIGSDAVENLLRHPTRRGRPRDCGQYDGEFVAAHPRHALCGLKERRHAPSHGPEQRVPSRVPEQIVDFLEAVEVQAKDSEVLTPRDASGDSLIELSVKATAIWNARQR